MYDDLINLFPCLDPSDQDILNETCQTAEFALEGPAAKEKPGGFDVKLYAVSVDAIGPNELPGFCEAASHHDPTRVVRPKS